MQYVSVTMNYVMFLPPSVMKVVDISEDWQVTIYIYARF